MRKTLSLRSAQQLTAFERCQKAIIRFDLYKQPFRLLLPDEKDEYRTFAGAILTIASICVVMIYAGFKVSTMLSFQDYKVQVRDFEDFYTDLTPFKAEEGFMIAAGLSLGHGESMDKSVGELKLYRKNWRIENNESDDYLRFTPVASRPCTRQDFNFDQEVDDVENATFYYTEKSQADVKKFLEHMICPADPENELFVQGNYNSGNSDNIMVVFELCDQTKTPDIVCKNQTEIEKALSYKYMVTVANQKRFVQHKFGEQRLSSTAELKWWAISPTVRIDHVEMLTRTEMDLNDDYWGFGQKAEDGFYILDVPARTLPYENKFHNSVTFEADLHQKYYFRKVYSSLDFLSEIGGLFSSFSRICFVIVTGMNYFGSFQFVMADNFYYRSGHDEQGKVYKNDVQWNSLKSLRLNIHTFFPKSMLVCCLQPNAAQRRRAKSYDHMLQETSVSHIIQQLRVLNAACKETRTPEEWGDLRKRHALMAYEDLDTDDESSLARDDEVQNIEMVMKPGSTGMGLNLQQMMDNQDRKALRKGANLLQGSDSFHLNTNEGKQRSPKPEIPPESQHAVNILAASKALKQDMNNSESSLNEKKFTVLTSPSVKPRGRPADVLS